MIPFWISPKHLFSETAGMNNIAKENFCKRKNFTQFFHNWEVENSRYERKQTSKIISSSSEKNKFNFQIRHLQRWRSNFRIPRNSFTCHWISIASIVLCLDLQSLPTHVSEADQSCGVFWSLAALASIVAFDLRQSRVGLSASGINKSLTRRASLKRGPACTVVLWLVRNWLS